MSEEHSTFSVIALKTIVLCIVIFPVTFIYSQNNDRWVAGSAKQLKGDIINYVCFISDADKQWTLYEKQEIINSIDKANSWIISESKKYSIMLSITNSMAEKDIYFDTIEAGKGSGTERVDWVYRVVSQLGFTNPKKALRSIKRKYNADNVQMIIVSNVNGRPYSMSYARGMNRRLYLFEGMIIYRKYNNGAPIPFEAVYSHELMHLYGAWDLYKTYSQTIERQELANELYPNDIMLRVDHDLEVLEVDELTAYLIGWSTNKPNNLEWFRPGDHKK